MSWRLLCIAMLAMVAVHGRAAAAAWADNKTVKVEQEWKGGSDEEKDNDAWKQQPKDGFIAGPKAWEELWKAWHFAKELPKVDFEKELILVVACEGPNSIRIEELKLNDKGSLRFDWSHTDKAGPGFRYLMQRISRNGIKTVGGKEIPKE